MKDLLRGELGFEGIIVSDAVGMGGIVGYMNVFDACATFLEAGGDILLFPRIGKKFYEEMKRCVEKGILSEETLVDRTARVLAFKDDLKSRGFFEAPKLYNREFHEVLAEKMTVNAMQIIRDRNEIIPTVTQRAQSVLHVIIKNEMVKNLNHVQRLTDELTSRYDIVREITNPGPDYLFDLAENKEYDLIVCSVVANYNFGTNVIRLNSGACRNLMQGWMHLNTPVVFISHNHPFIEEEYKAVMDTVINTYGSTRYTADAICELIKPSHSVSQKNENIECSCSH
jgi:beta-N-acetylhexosaminidase